MIAAILLMILTFSSSTIIDSSSTTNCAVSKLTGQCQYYYSDSNKARFFALPGDSPGPTCTFDWPLPDCVRQAIYQHYRDHGQ